MIKMVHSVGSLVLFCCQCWPMVQRPEVDLKLNKNAGKETKLLTERS